MSLTYFQIFLKVSLVYALIVYLIGWFINSFGIVWLKEHILLVFILVSIIVYITTFVSYALGGKVINLNMSLMLLASMFLWTLRLGFVVYQTWREIDRSQGFTQKQGETIVIGPKVVKSHEVDKYVICVLRDTALCSKFEPKKILFYTPYQACNINGTLNYKPISKLKSYDVLNRIYLQSQNIDLDCEDTFLSKIFKMRDSIILKISKTINEPQSSLLQGIIFGTNLSFDEEVEKGIKAAGISHIVAASGYNVALLITALDGIFAWLPLRLLIILKFVFIWIYALLTGFSSSMVRACAMSSVALISKFFKWNIDSKNILALSMVLLIYQKPIMMWDLGFLLSISATWGVMYLSPIIEKKVDNTWFPSTTLACTLTTLPITLAHFNVVSIYSVVANMIILPVIELVMIVGILGLLMKPFMYVAYGNLKFVEIVSSVFERLPYSVIEVDKNVSIVLGILILIMVFTFIKQYSGKSIISNN